MTTRTFLKIVINTALGVFLIWIWLKFVDIDLILNKISTVNPISLLPVFLFMILSPVVRAMRLKIFISKIKKISLKDLVFLNGVAMMLNFFIPIRGGEIAKGIYLSTSLGLPLGKSVIWVFLDRFLDFLVVLALSAVLLIIVPTTLSITVIKVIIVILILALFSTYLAIYQVRFTRKIASFLSHLLIEKHIKIYFERFIEFTLDSFTILKRSSKDLFLLSILTVLGYAADSGIWYFIFVSLGFPQDVLKMYLGQLLSALTYIIPAAPGYVGSAEASGLLILSGIFNMDANLASAMIVLFHLLSAIFVLIFGIISVFFLKIDLGLILKRALNRG